MDIIYCKHMEMSKAIVVRVFKIMLPNFLLGLSDDPTAIAQGLTQRDGRLFSLKEIANQQTKEIDHAKHIATVLRIPIKALTIDANVVNVASNLLI